MQTNYTYNAIVNAGSIRPASYGYVGTSVAGSGIEDPRRDDREYRA